MTPRPFPQPEGLATLVQRDGIDIRPTLLRVLTDLYVEKPSHTAAEKRQFTELALRLVDAVDEEARTAIAERLMRHPDAPGQVLRRLAQKPTASAAATAILGRTSQTVAAHAGAGGASTAEHIPAVSSLTDLFFAAASFDRRLILLNIGYAALPPAPAVAPALARAAVADLERAALTRRTDEFIRRIEESLGLPRALARRIAEDPRGEPFLVVARALDMPADVLQRILLFLDPAIGHSVTRVSDLSTFYAEITRDAAFRLIAIWRAEHRLPVRDGRHRPLHWDDETVTGRRLASPPPRQAQPAAGSVASDARRRSRD